MGPNPKPRVRHYLKCDPPYFSALKSGEKTAEIRYDDRDYQRGDVLEIRAYDRKKESFVLEGPDTDTLFFDVTHVLKGAPYLPEGYVMLSLRNRLDR